MSTHRNVLLFRCSRARVAALTAHIRGLILLNAFHLERLGDSRALKVLGNHLCLLLASLVDGGKKGKTRAHRGLRYPATTLPAIFVSLSLTHKPSTGSQCSGASHCVYESTVQYFMTWAELISPLQLACLPGLSHLPALGPAGCRVTNGKDVLR